VNLLSTDFPFKSQKSIAQKFLCTIGCRPNNYIIEDLGHAWGTPLKNCLGVVCKQGFNKASNYLGKETLWFQGFNMDMIWLSKVNGPALPKERCIKVDKAPPEKKRDLRKNFSQ